MSGRDKLLLILAVVVAAGCVRLGVWQLERLAERRAYNRTVLAGLSAPSVDVAALRGTVEANRYRPVTVRGRYDPEQELVLAHRPRRGLPGVHLLTPLFPAGSDTAVLVVRGWAYAPDAAHPELERWREESAAGSVGYVRAYDAPADDARASGTGRILRRLEYDAASERVPYPLAPYLVIVTADGADSGTGRPPRLDTPALGEGNHLSYAFQWFAFATVALAGTAVFIRHSHRARRGGSESEFEPR